MSSRIDPGGAARRAWQRAWSTWQPVGLAAVAAALAWWIAHTLLGHPQPFFAPIAAAIALSISRIQRARRTVQMMCGVLLGIGIGEALVAAFGTTLVSLGVIVFVAMIAARIVGVGFFGEGMMFPNQAAASAILVVTLHRHGTGGERAIDALLGGGVALVLGVVLFPAHPLRLLEDAERAVLRVLAEALEQVAQVLGRDGRLDRPWALESGQRIHRALGALAQARATASANVRVAPRRWVLRRAVTEEILRLSQLDLLANAVLGLVRTAATSTYGERPVSPAIQASLRDLAGAIGGLAATAQPWPAAMIRGVEQLRDRVPAPASGAGLDRDAIVGSVLRAAVEDLTHVVVPSRRGLENLPQGVRDTAG